MFWRKSKASVDAETIDWMLECWQWLDEFLGPIDSEPKRHLILPSRSIFPDTILTGHAKAQHYFTIVRDLCGMRDEDWPVDLVEQPPAPNFGDSMMLANYSTNNALGTFSIEGNSAVITYDPDMLSDPIQTVGTMAHELAHFLMLNAQSDPPGGEELEELATDLATVHLGFGLFGANSAFQFKQTRDYDQQSWSTKRSGYLSEGGWCFGCALFMEILEIDPESYRAYAKESVATQIRKNRIYLATKPEVIRNCRSPDAADLP